MWKQNVHSVREDNVSNLLKLLHNIQKIIINTTLDCYKLLSNPSETYIKTWKGKMKLKHCVRPRILFFFKRYYSWVWLIQDFSRAIKITLNYLILYDLGVIIMKASLRLIYLTLIHKHRAEGIFQIAIFGKKSGNIRAKPLGFRASNGKKYSDKRLQPPPPPPPRTKLVPYAYVHKENLEIVMNMH